MQHQSCPPPRSAQCGRLLACFCLRVLLLGSRERWLATLLGQETCNPEVVDFLVCTFMYWLRGNTYLVPIISSTFCNLDLVRVVVLGVGCDAAAPIDLVPAARRVHGEPRGCPFLSFTGIC